MSNCSSRSKLTINKSIIQEIKENPQKFNLFNGNKWYYKLDKEVKGPYN